MKRVLCVLLTLLFAALCAIHVFAAPLTFDENNVCGYTWTSYRYTGSVTTGDAALREELL